MFDTTSHDGAPLRVHVSFVQCVKAGVGFTIGAALLPLALFVVQVITRVPVATLAGLLPHL